MVSGRPVIDKDLCKGCELCISVCPQKILTLSETVNDLGTAYAHCENEEKCSACSFCALICPECAIQIIRYERVLTS
jgi:2-oxoglutarate ferredoxin oxidoreductase subunit delta